MRQHDVADQLRRLGLGAAESRAYLALVAEGPLRAAEVAELADLPRSSTYPVLRSLVEQGLAEAGAGYRSRFRALPPADALGGFLAKQREQLGERERQLAAVLGPLTEMAAQPGARGAEEVVEVLRSPGAVAERFERLQLSATREIHVLVKAPVLVTREGNPAQAQMAARNVRYRGLYERAVLDDPEVGPYLEQWIAAGEEARLFPGELPLKLAIFDGRSVLMPLETPGRGSGVTSVLIRHEALGCALVLLFEALWDRSEPCAGGKPGKARPGRRRAAQDTSQPARARTSRPARPAQRTARKP